MRRLASNGLNAALAARFADGAVHSMDEAVAACGHLVPPEIAMRKFAQMRGAAGLPLSMAVERGRLGVVATSLKQLGAEPRGLVRRKPWQAFSLPPGEYGVLRGERSRQALLTDDMVRTMRSRRAEGASYAGLAREFGVDPDTVRKAVLRISWKHVE